MEELQISDFLKFVSKVCETDLEMREKVQKILNDEDTMDEDITFLKNNGDDSLKSKIFSSMLNEQFLRQKLEILNKSVQSYDKEVTK